MREAFFNKTLFIKNQINESIIVFSKMVESETVMFTNNWTNYDVKDTGSSQFFCENLSACDKDTYFENIQTILIFLKYYCCVSHLKYYEIIFFFDE